MSIPPQEADTTPADTLRRAAALMRHQAAGIAPGMARIAWHPAVALAVADWLDACALVVTAAPFGVGFRDGGRHPGRRRRPA